MDFLFVLPSVAPSCRLSAVAFSLLQSFRFPQGNRVNIYTIFHTNLQLYFPALASGGRSVLLSHFHFVSFVFHNKQILIKKSSITIFPKPYQCCEDSTTRSGDELVNQEADNFIYQLTFDQYKHCAKNLCFIPCFFAALVSWSQRSSHLKHMWMLVFHLYIYSHFGHQCFALMAVSARTNIYVCIHLNRK